MMQLQINGDLVINELQREFSKVYPFLKIEFFRNGASKYSADQRIPQTKKLREAWKPGKKEDVLLFNDATTVMELEKSFMDRFGLAAQVFRKSGNVWLESIMTDNLTLKQQNDHGRELSTVVPGNKYESDFDLERDSDH